MSESRRGCLAVCSEADHKLCRLGRGRGGGVKNSRFYLVKRNQSGRGSKTADFETIQFMGGPLGYLRASKKWRNAKKASSMTAQQTQKALGFRIAVPPPPLPPHQPLATIPPPLSSSAGPALTQMSNLLRNELLAFTFEHFSLVAVLSGRIALSEAAQLAHDIEEG